MTVIDQEIDDLENVIINGKLDLDDLAKSKTPPLEQRNIKKLTKISRLY